MELHATGHRYTFTTTDGQPHRIEGRSLGPAYSEERLLVRFSENCRGPSVSAGVPALSRAAAGVGGIAERLIGDIHRESHAGHADVPDYHPRPRPDPRRDQRDGRDHF